MTLFINSLTINCTYLFVVKKFKSLNYTKKSKLLDKFKQIYSCVMKHLNELYI